MQRKLKAHHGFTLIEILIVIGIIAVLAAIVLVAVNPARQFAQANNSQRSTNVNALLNAVGQYIVDKKGDLSGLDITTTAREIGSGSGKSDLCDDLVPTYLPALPADPSKDDQSISENECDNYSLGYEIEKDDNGRVIISAPDAEDIDGETVVIEVTR